MPFWTILWTWWVFFPIDSTQLVSWLPAVCSEAKSTKVICMEKFFIPDSCVSCNSERFNFFDLDFSPLALTFTNIAAFSECSRSSSTISDDCEWSRRPFKPFFGHGGGWWVLVGDGGGFSMTLK